MNLIKTRCRADRCTATAAWLVSGGFCAYLLCPAHTRAARRRRHAPRVVASAAFTTPDPTLDAAR
ncbi:hypothetical protein [Streptomyces sp. cg36]|uniref:hypothetical protein n=1 Tax=Streptomyces sp. cg36 TaxID=3238798 RepID=UPI0034E2D1A9